MGQKNTSLFDFKYVFTDLLNSFRTIQENKGEDKKSVSEENRFLLNISNPLFIVALNQIVLYLLLVFPQSLQIY